MVNCMKGPKLPHGLTWFGIATAGYSAYATYRKNEELKKENEQLNQKYEEANQNSQDFKNSVEETNNSVKSLENKVDNLNNTINDYISKSNKFISNFSFTSFKDLKDLFNKYMDFISSFDLQQQILIFNSLTSFFLLSLLSSFLFSKYGNFLITKFQLEERFPKIYKILYYRTQVQKYYYIYISFLAISSLIFSLFINLSILLT